ncbi:hypothetical protein V9T40_004526 [Parthenolecanium corni]|uniref:Acidic leucine-rich nuclear phosphoprotein 32 family member A n=1 Tax=Parthenolecanium corni TaxID=536013 RepID=A0AAN9U3J8_9HEMI
MEKRIDLEKRGKDPKMITDLNLDNCRSPNITGLTEEFTNLENLSLMNVGLTSLKGFPKLPNLKKLELSQNRISNGLHVLLSCPKLTELNLSGNKIKDLTPLEPLKDLKSLKKLDLSNNETIMIDNYRDEVFRLIPQLKYLDGFDVHNEASSDSEADDEEMNVDDEDEDADEDGGDDDDEGEDEEAEEEDEDDIGLETVYKDNLDEESEGDDYDGEGEGEDEEDGLEEEESENDAEDEKEESVVRGKKRKHEDEDAGE